MSQNFSDGLLDLDGDQVPATDLPNPDTLNKTEQEKLGSVIKAAFNVEPLHVSDGHAEPASGYLRWIRERLRYLDAVCPEFVLLEGLIGREMALKKAATNQDAKKHLIEKLEAEGHRTDAASLSAAASYILKKDNEAYSHIDNLVLILKEFLNHDLASGGGARIGGAANFYPLLFPL